MAEKFYFQTTRGSYHKCFMIVSLNDEREERGTVGL